MIDDQVNLSFSPVYENN